jgi:DNA-directed RNA polymerase subunit N (RpoN/RPB10)
MPVVCFNCGSTIGHLIIPFYDFLIAKSKMGGNMNDNRDICEQLKVSRDCCKKTLITFVPDNTLRRYLAIRYKDDKILL